MRNLESLLMSVILPVVLMLMFVYVFGGAIDPAGNYANYVVPGIILLCTGYGAASTAVDVARDMAEGVVDRFRSMPILSSAVLTGHVVASIARNALATVLVIGVAFLPGSAAGRRGRVAGGGRDAAAVGAGAVLGGGLLRPDRPHRRGGERVHLPGAVPPVPVQRVRAGGDDGAGLGAVAAHQPVTPITETLRGLLLGTPIGSYGWQALAWCAGLLVAAYVAATVLFRRRTTG